MGTAGGRSPGAPCAAARRAVGLASEGRGESCRPATARPPGGAPAAYGGSLWPFFPLDCFASALAVHGLGRQARRAEGAPLKP
jgi:hypothetical protein